MNVAKRTKRDSTSWVLTEEGVAMLIETLMLANPRRLLETRPRVAPSDMFTWELLQTVYAKGFQHEASDSSDDWSKSYHPGG